MNPNKVAWLPNNQVIGTNHLSLYVECKELPWPDRRAVTNIAKHDPEGRISQAAKEANKIIAKLVATSKRKQS